MSLQGDEYIETNQISTRFDHDDQDMQILTEEWGNGQSYARYNNANAPLVDYMHIDFDNDNIVDGWYHMYDLTGMGDSGLLEFSAKSNGYPWNTKSMQLTIR